MTGGESQVSGSLQELVVFVQDLKQIVCRRVDGTFQCKCGYCEAC